MTGSICARAALAAALCGTLGFAGCAPPPGDHDESGEQLQIVRSALTEGQDPPLTPTGVTVAATGTLTILGLVRDRNTVDHVPLPGVRIALSGPVTGAAFTDSNGVYRFRNLPAGTYTLTASRAGASFTPSPRTVVLGSSSTVRGFDCTAGCQAATPSVSSGKSLVMVHPTVINDARARTGNWSFRFLMEQMTPVGVDPADFAMRWVEGFRSSAGPVNGFPVDNRDTETPFLRFWPRRADGKLDLARSPFRLVAIVNRSDLNRSGNGEVRFVFAMQATTPESFTGSFTVIFEFKLPTRSSTGASLSRLSWIQQFQNLGALSFGSSYNAALQVITDKVVKRGTNSTAPNGSSIGQVRTNEIQMGPVWQLRQFHLLNDATGKGFLKLVQPAQTPDNSKDNHADLAAYLRSQRVDIVGGFAPVPSALMGGQSNVLGPWSFTSFPDITEQTRRAFAGQTCNGCHNGEASVIDGFYHISPFDPFEPPAPVTGEERLSGFMRQVEIPRRQRFMQNRLTCASDLSNCSPGSEALVAPAFVAASP